MKPTVCKNCQYCKDDCYGWIEYDFCLVYLEDCAYVLNEQKKRGLENCPTYKPTLWVLFKEWVTSKFKR